MKKDNWYVYELIDPANGLPFYVGKGSGRRMYAHGLHSDTSNKYKLAKISKIGYANVIRNKVASFWDEQAAYICESDRICSYINSGHKLTNISIATTLSSRIGKTFDSMKVIEFRPWATYLWLCNGRRNPIKATGFIVYDWMLDAYFNILLPTHFKEAIKIKSNVDKILAMCKEEQVKYHLKTV